MIHGSLETYIGMFSTIIGFGDQIFTVIVLILSAGISVHICYGYGTRKGREVFIGLLLMLLIGVQFYHLLNAAIYMPATRFYVYNSKYHRNDCLLSTKGGKRPQGSIESYDYNPCFCHAGAVCSSKSNGTIYKSSACPKDGSASCIEPISQRKVKLFIKFLRDCEGGRGKYCTKSQPCKPCEVDSLMEFGGERCRTCTSENKGLCNFIPRVGPYCLIRNDSKAIQPCKTCCTEPKLLLWNNQTCY